MAYSVGVLFACIKFSLNLWSIRNASLVKTKDQTQAHIRQLFGA
ncbi:hypothetical protein HPS_1505 [Glaesserella parasuis 29755]|uniref:Uncharacterized protein n=1 Tax=Glaesserella parasuis serovar 5 (strain SH0165) TaxID=557723 RepID=B8F6K5_GLAP5|nr:hypothetical protein HAPS_1377 [Glaesserella parasuis SH0165]EQA08487.1 hypothetical protein HPS8415995_1437 [Glaesserella parasuis 84-15995]EQA94922.1 hypothetical protein HPS_1505 [Glaesserella parasuis 29755]